MNKDEKFNQKTQDKNHFLRKDPKCSSRRTACLVSPLRAGAESYLGFSIVPST